MADKKAVNVVLLLGSFFERRDMLAKIRKHLNGADEYIAEGEETFEYLQTEIMLSSCFSDKRLVIIREQPTYNTTRPTFLKNFRAMLSKVPDDCVLVIDNPTDLGDLLVKDVSKVGKVYEFDEYLQKKDATRWICDRYKDRDRNVEYEWAT
ncbi:MAG: hypothetical protein HC888_00155 [Candidatus Competibacteraceae bacterium]|nr:hypothetical protein [Candidatus Competibacteraceae bacterium]